MAQQILSERTFNDANRVRIQLITTIAIAKKSYLTSITTRTFPNYSYKRTYNLAKRKAYLYFQSVILFCYSILTSILNIVSTRLEQRQPRQSHFKIIFFVLFTVLLFLSFTITIHNSIKYIQIIISKFRSAQRLSRLYKAQAN